MTESKEGGASAKIDASHAKSGVGLGSDEDPVSLPDLSAFESRVRELQRGTLALVRDIPQSKKSITRNCQKLKDAFRLLLAGITHNEEIRVHPEPAVSGVECTEQSLLPRWCNHEVSETEGF